MLEPATLNASILGWYFSVIGLGEGVGVGLGVVTIELGWDSVPSCGITKMPSFTRNCRLK